MIHALLHGQLSREQENMEDLLTSAVFGLLRYLPPSEGILPFLSCARALDGSQALPKMPHDTLVRTCFWPWVAESGCASCEPDIRVDIEPPEGNRTVIFVEAKYRSGKSSEADDVPERPYDQLAREWDNLVHLAHPHTTPMLVYLTADVGMPREEMSASVAEYRGKRGGNAPTICWVSWRHLHDVLDANRGVIHKDLLDMLERLDLHFFRGVHVPAPMTARQWTFGRYNWEKLKCETSWKFKGGCDE